MILITRIFFFLIGFGLTIIGSIYIISYLNLMTIGYNFYEYVNFITRRIECFYAPVGMALIVLTIFIPGGEKYELHI